MVALSLHCLAVWVKLKVYEETDAPHLLMQLTVAVWGVRFPATVENINNWLRVSASVSRKSVFVLELDY